MSQICEACAFLPVQHPACSKATFSAAGETGHGDRPKRVDGINVGSVKHYTFSKADLDNFPGETSSHLISAARAEQGGSERPVWHGCSSPHACSKWALSNHSSAEWPQAARPGGRQRGHFAQSINAFISEVSERKTALGLLAWASSSSSVDYFPNKHCCLLSTNSSTGKVVESCAALHCSHKLAEQSSVFWCPWTSNLNNRAQSPNDRFSG